MARPESIRVGKKRLPVIARRKVNGRDYLLLEELSSTPRGSRFHAFDPKAGLHGEQRRLLTFPRNRASESQIRLLQRAKRHDHLFAHILDLERNRDHFVVVMDWVPGPTLRAYLTEVRQGRVKRPSLREAFRLSRDLARGLCKLHRLSFVVHGDIHPENLILHRDSGRLVLIDFGSAWCLESSVSRDVGDGIRSIYSAPEVCAGEQAAHEFADQFVATLIMYELMTLVIPYEGLGGKAGWPEHLDEMCDLLVPPVRLHPDAPRLPTVIREGIDRVVIRGLSLLPESRYPTSQDWLNDLDRVWLTINNPTQRGGINDSMSRWIARIVAWFGASRKRTP